MLTLQLHQCKMLPIYKVRVLGPQPFSISQDFFKQRRLPHRTVVSGLPPPKVF